MEAASATSSPLCPRFSDPGSTGVDVLAGRGNMGMAIFTNGTGATSFFHVFSTTKANVSLGTTTASFTVAVSASSTFTLEPFYPILFSNGCSVFATTATTGSTASATGHNFQFFVN